MAYALRLRAACPLSIASPQLAIFFLALCRWLLNGEQEERCGASGATSNA
jgi:hypothetical protein